MCSAMVSGADGAASGRAGRSMARLLGGLGEVFAKADRIDAHRFALGLEAGAERLAPGDDGRHPGGFTAVANAISILFDDPAFQEAMQRIGTSVASITIPTLNLASSYHQASAATSSYTSAVDANAKAAEDAAARVQDAWQSIADSLLDTARSIRGELADAGDHSLAYWKSQLAIQTAMARAGDQDAAKGLEALANSLVKAAETEATSRFELQQIRATTAASLEQTAAYAQAYANGATVPTSSQAYTTAAALPAVQVPASSQVVVAESPQMLALMQELVDMLRDSSAANGTRLEEVNRTLTNFKRNGVPTRAWTPA